MLMTKELEKRLTLMQRFNQVLNKRYTTEKVYNNKIFVHNDIMYATDGHIFVMAANLTDQKDFSYFKCNGKKFEYLDSGIQEVKKTGEYTSYGEAYEKILQQFNYTSVSFDIDFEGYPLPVKLCSSWSRRQEDNLEVNFQTKEAVIAFGNDVTGTYGDIIKNVSGAIPEKSMKFAFWHIMEIMKRCKVNKLHIESYPDRQRSTCKVGDYTFIFTHFN